MSENCPYCDAAMQSMEDQGYFETWYCRYCQDAWVQNFATGVMEKLEFPEWRRMVLELETIRP